MNKSNGKSTRMMYLQSLRDSNLRTNKIAFRVTVDKDNLEILWQMSLCSKHDTFIKKKAIENCQTSPIFKGTTKTSPTLISLGDGWTHKYIHEAIITDAIRVIETSDPLPIKASLSSTGMEEKRNTPSWLIETLRQALINSMDY